MAITGTWYAEMVDDVDQLLRLLAQVGEHDDLNRPYARVVEELRADDFVLVQKSVNDLSIRIFDAARRGVVDEGILYETMGLLVDLIPYVRCAAQTSANCDGGFAFLMSRIEKLLGSMMMAVRASMGFIDPLVPALD